MTPRQTLATVLEHHRVGAYHRLVLDCAPIAPQVVPGHFVAIAVGGPDTSMLLRRSFSVHRVDGDRLEVVLAVHGRGTAWLSRRRPGDLLDVVGPLGVPFRVPERPGRAVLVGGGYGTAPLVPLAVQLRQAGWQVDAVVGAARAALLFGVELFEAAGIRTHVTTDDGSAGTPGRVTAVLPGLVSGGAPEVFACGPMAMLAAVEATVRPLAPTAGVQCAVEEAMACGIGICMTCVLPVVGDDGRTRMVRACTEGPIFDGARVRWADVGSVPSDVVGAPRAGGH